jgi:hypothetical protein
VTAARFCSVLHTGRTRRGGARLEIVRLPMNHSPYRPLVVMTLLSFASMYLLMYAMVNVVDNVYGSVNQVYMAGLMTAPMVAIELLVMRAMYHDTRRNLLILTSSVVVGIVCFALIRQQTGVADQQFLRSMIPHHAGAILMCKESPIEDAELKALCRQIVVGQQAEIAQMKAKLGQLTR